MNGPMTRPEPIVNGSRITWRCAKCSQPIRARDGHLAVDPPWLTADPPERNEGVTTLSDIPIPVREKWLPLHYRCDPRCDYFTYNIAVGEIETHDQLLRWTGHLMRKVWIIHTDWPELLIGIPEQQSTKGRGHEQCQEITKRW